MGQQDSDMVSQRLNMDDVFGRGTSMDIAGDMLEYTQVNRYFSLQAARYTWEANFIGDALGLSFLQNDILDLEHRQLGVNGYSRIQAIQAKGAGVEQFTKEKK